jgi:hypothetical protein
MFETDVPLVKFGVSWFCALDKSAREARRELVHRHWVSKYILLIPQMESGDEFARRKRNGKTYHARLQVALHTQIAIAQAGVIEERVERYPGIVVKWIHIPCEILVKWN